MEKSDADLMAIALLRIYSDSHCPDSHGSDNHCPGSQSFVSSSLWQTPQACTLMRTCPATVALLVP
jgi:hypothetical protein